MGSGHSEARAQPASPGGRPGMTILPLKRQRFALQRRCRLEKSADQIEKRVEPVVVNPMAGVFDRDDLRVAEMASPPVVYRVGGPTLLAVDEEGRAIDALPYPLGLGRRHLVGRLGPDIVVELPAVGAVLVLVDPV